MFKVFVVVVFLLLFFQVYSIDKEEHYRQCISAIDERFLVNDIGILNQTQIDFIHNLFEQVYHCAKDSALPSSTPAVSAPATPISTIDKTFFSKLVIFDNIFESFAALTVILGSVYEIYCRFQYHKLQQKFLIASLPDGFSISPPTETSSFEISSNHFSILPRRSIFSIKQLAALPKYKALNESWNTSLKGKIV